MALPPHIVVIDPAVKKAEIDCFNHLLELSDLPLSYHLPALYGMDSLKRESKGVSGFLILGSQSSVNDRLPWQAPLEEWLKPWLDKGIPTFACCYGHQMIAHLFGGKVAYRTNTQEKLVGMREVELSQNALWGAATTGRLYVTHNEIVTHLSSELVNTAKSRDVENDGIAHKSLPIWGFQSHPETTSSLIAQDKTAGITSDDLQFGYGLLRKFFTFAKKNK